MQCAAWIDCGTLPDWIMAITAIVAAWIGLVQLGGLKEQERRAADAAVAQAQAADALTNATDNQVQIARSRILLELDRDFESQEMWEARRASRGLRNAIVALAEKNQPALNEVQREVEADVLFSEYLNRLWHDYRTVDTKPRPRRDELDDLITAHLESDRNIADVAQMEPFERAATRYLLLTRCLGWFETVGRLTNEGLAPRADVIALYDQVFREIMRWYGDHIRHRTQSGGRKNPKWMAEALMFFESMNAEIAFEEQRLANMAQAERSAAKKGVSSFER